MFLLEESKKWVGQQKENEPCTEEVGVAVGHFLQMNPMQLLIEKLCAHFSFRQWHKGQSIAMI